jgi:hypothetical protein
LYLCAQEDGDGQAARPLLTSGARQQLVALVVKEAKGLITTRPSCVDAVGLVHAVAGPLMLGALESARIEQLQVSGVNASAEVVDGTEIPPQQASLEKSGAAWKIAGVPALGERFAAHVTEAVR